MLWAHEDIKTGGGEEGFDPNDPATKVLESMYGDMNA